MELRKSDKANRIPASSGEPNHTPSASSSLRGPPAQQSSANSLNDGSQSVQQQSAPRVDGSSDELTPAQLSGLTTGIHTPFLSGEQYEDTYEHLNQTRHQRVRAAIFPETLQAEEGGDDLTIPSTQIDPNNPTNVQRLAEPSQMLRHAVSNLLHYQNDADLARSAMPGLVQLLNDEDRIITARAALFVHQLSMKEASRHAIIGSPEMVESLINVMQAHASTEDATKFTVGTLQNISQHSDGQLAIFRSGGIPALVRMLGSSAESVLFYSMTTLHNLLVHHKESREVVMASGGVQKMVRLLRSRDHAKFLAIVVDCLRILMFNNQEAKLIVTVNEGPAEIVRIMATYTYDKLLYVTLKALKILSVFAQAKEPLIKAAIIPVLTKQLREPSRMQDCLWTLRNLSDAATKERDMDELMLILIGLLDNDARDSNNIVTCAASIISNLTCNNTYNKIFVCEHGGIHALVRTCMQASDREEIAEPAVCALRHCTSRHEAAEAAQHAVRQIPGGLEIAVKLLHPPSHWALIKAVCGLVRNLAHTPSNQAPLRKLGAIQRLIHLTMQAFQDMQQRRASITSMNSGQQQQRSMQQRETVRMEEVIDGTIGALQILARDMHNRAEMKAMNAVPIVVQLLDYPNENIVRVVVGLLNELAEDRDGCDLIERENPTQKLTQLLHSRSEGTQTYAAAVLYKLSAGQPAEFRNSLGVELQQSLYIAGGQNNTLTTTMSSSATNTNHTRSHSGNTMPTNYQQHRAYANGGGGVIMMPQIVSNGQTMQQHYQQQQYEPPLVMTPPVGHEFMDVGPYGGSIKIMGGSGMPTYAHVYDSPMDAADYGGGSMHYEAVHHGGGDGMGNVLYAQGVDEAGRVPFNIQQQQQQRQGPGTMLVHQQQQSSVFQDTDL